MVTHRIPSWSWLVGLIAASLFSVRVTAADDAKGQPEVTRIVEAALKAELAGKNVTRRNLLARAMEAAPDHVPAHWQSGMVRDNNSTWVDFRDLTSTNPYGLLAEYRSVRERAGTSVRDRLRLADWCRDNGLADAERAHLMQVLELDPEHASARQRLGHVNLNGLWVSFEQIALAAARQQETAGSLQKWGATIQESLRLLSGVRRQQERGRELLFDIRDPSAIPAMERLLATGNDASGLLLIEWLSRLNVYEASQAIARTALVSPRDSVRRAAADSLSSRPFDEYVPVLLGALRTPVTAKSRAYVNPFGWVVLDLIFDAEAQHDRRQLVLTQETAASALLRNVSSQAGTPIVVNDFRRMDWGDVRAIENSFRTRQREAGHARLQWNQLIRNTNRRAESVLRDVTGIRDHAGPEEWWQWWDDFNELHVTGTKPLLRVQPEPERQYISSETKVVADQPLIEFPTIPRFGGGGGAGGSCLVAGTPVWTEQGWLPIEQIQVGDRVLAQHTESGELDYQPVLKTTVRPPVPTLRISCEGVQFRATGGHPFWVNGEGWRFARDLQPGMHLHGVEGSQAIHSIEPADKAEAFNLVVADFHTYFLGEGEILSHDNTPREPTNALVPGLRREP